MSDQDTEDELKLSALHAQLILNWLQGLKHDPSLDSLARGAINGHVAVCRTLKIPDEQIRHGLLAAVNAVLPKSTIRDARLGDDEHAVAFGCPCNACTGES